MNCCFDCAYCSTYALRPVDVCDLDDHEIIDVYMARCEDFIPVEEETT